MNKLFGTLKVGEFFMWDRVKHQKISEYRSSNAVIIEGQRIGDKISLGEMTEVTPLDVAFTLRKVTLADIKVGTKFLYDGVEYYKSDEKHHTRGGSWCVMNVKTPWIIASMPLTTVIEVK